MAGWLLIFAAILLVCCFATYTALNRWSEPSLSGVATALVYAAAVVVAAQATDAAVQIHQETSHQAGLIGSFEAQAVVATLAQHVGDIAWQAGLLLAAATVVVMLPRRRA